MTYLFRVTASKTSEKESAFYQHRPIGFHKNLSAAISRRLNCVAPKVLRRVAGRQAKGSRVNAAVLDVVHR
jgi:hypothetical protein